MKPDGLQPRFRACLPEDFEMALAIRVAALRPLMEQLGRNNPSEARKRMEVSFHPEHSQFVLVGEIPIGFYTFRPAADGYHLEHLYIVPEYQGRGVGTNILVQLIAKADAGNQPIFLGTARGNPAGAWYEKHGFRCSTHAARTSYYIRQPSRIGRR